MGDDRNMMGQAGRRTEGGHGRLRARAKRKLKAMRFPICHNHAWAAPCPPAARPTSVNCAAKRCASCVQATHVSPRFCASTCVAATEQQWKFPCQQLQASGSWWDGPASAAHCCLLQRHSHRFPFPPKPLPA